MRILLDTNIIIHREASKVINQDIGILFNWLDKLHYTKSVHPLTLMELNRNINSDIAKTMQIKLANYHQLQTVAPLNEKIKAICDLVDNKPNDFDDTKLLNEVFSNRVDILISEDKKIHLKASLIGIAEKVFRIDTFLEKLISENPDFVDYKVLAVKREYFGHIDPYDDFFNSFRGDYNGFDVWYHGKAGNNDKAYVCYEAGLLKAFLFLKVEEKTENYANIQPTFSPKKRLKIGTFKVVSNGLRIGERFLKIVFDNAKKYKVEEIYVTIFDHRPELLNLISLLEKFGFQYHGEKETSSGIEKVYVRDFSKQSNDENPKLTFPWLSKTSDAYIVPINPDYHTELFPDSILRTESPENFIENEPHRNSISKVYVSHSKTRHLNSGDILIFYRSGDRAPKIHSGVVTTIGIVENVITNIQDEQNLIDICKKRTALTTKELKEYWNKYPANRPFVLNFLFAFSFQKRMTLANMLNNGILPNMEYVKTITKIDRKALVDLILLSGI